jgi:Restriction endonuclease AspBHI N-terminal/Restriction endonuclease
MREIMELFKLYRYVKPSPGPEVELIDGYQNIFNATRWPAWPGLEGAGRVQLDHGIDSVVRVKAIDGVRRPAILIASKPHRAGSDWTPWHDELNPERGHIRYFGDNKASMGPHPLATTGNRSVIEEFPLYQSSSRDERLRAAPMLFFESMVHGGRAKGFWRFIGVGMVERAELVTQVDPRGRWFVNYVFDCAVLDLSPESLQVSWSWIAARRDPTKTLEEALALAPSSWRLWVEQGAKAIERVRQSINRTALMTHADQRPEPGTPGESALRTVVSHYKRTGTYEGVGEHRFEGLASEVVGTALRESGQYRPGWITKRSGDGGVDFVSRLDIGAGAGALKLVVLGQAKCVAESAPPASGLDLARTVARLDRGWVGAFVTTGHFSEQAQREVIGDRFPLLLLSGRQVGEAVVKEALLQGTSVEGYLASVDATYDARLSSRLPIEVLSD